MNRSVTVLALALTFGLAASAFEWRPITQSDRLGGRMVSVGYLKGKVVMVDFRDYGDEKNADDIRTLQALWSTYKSKPFVLIGSHIGNSNSKEVEAVLKKCGATFPVYRRVGVVEPEVKDEDGKTIPPRDISTFMNSYYIIDSTSQRRIAWARDVRKASSSIGSALVSLSSPMHVKHWERLLDYEIENLPGRAYLRLEEFREKFPKESRRYDAAWKRLDANAEVQDLAKLVKLSMAVKDRDMSTKSSGRITPELLSAAENKYAPLKKSADPNVSQEAKNALADLKFCAATL